MSLMVLVKRSGVAFRWLLQHQIDADRKGMDAAVKPAIRLLARVGLVVALMSGIALLVPSQASAASSGERHCLLTVTGKDANGTFQTTPMRCFKTYNEVLAARGLGREAYGTSATALQAQLTWAIGIHYEHENYGGSSFTVSGSDCKGGGLPVPSGWNDRISSTLNGCGSIVHYQHINYSGATFTTSGGGGNITGSMNDQTSSLRYFN